MALSKKLFREYPDEYIFVLSEKYLQDSLEEHFAEHCRRGGCSDNSTVDQFQDQALYLNVMKSGLIDNLHGNTSGIGVRNPEIDIRDTRKLLTRKSKNIWKLSSRC